MGTKAVTYAWDECDVSRKGDAVAAGDGGDGHGDDGDL